MMFTKSVLDFVSSWSHQVEDHELDTCNFSAEPAVPVPVKNAPGHAHLRDPACCCLQPCGSGWISQDGNAGTRAKEKLPLKTDG